MSDLTEHQEKSNEDHDKRQKHAGGRPTKYHEGMPKRVLDYLNEYMELGHVIPTKAGLSIYLDIAKDTVIEWCKEEGKEEFSGALRKLESEQELRLFAGGLNGDYNATIAKLGLGNHGYSDKQETKLDASVNVKEMSIEELTKIANGG